MLRWIERLPPATGAEADTHGRRIYILPTGAGLGYAAILLATLLGSLNYQNNLGLLLTFLMVSVSLVSMHHCWFQLLGLRVAARNAAPVFCGQPAVFPLRITEQRNRSRLGLCVGSAAGIELPAAGTVQVTLRVPTQQRGDLALEPVLLATAYPFGLLRAWTRLPLRASVLVYPRPAEQAPAPARITADRSDKARKKPAKQDLISQDSTGDRGAGGDDFIGPRPYRPGDSPRRLDWKALARGRGLVVKEFGSEQGSRVLVDWYALGVEDSETRLSLLTTQALRAHAQGGLWALRLPGTEIAPGRGDRHLHRCLAALARWPEADGRAPDLPPHDRPAHG